MLAVVSETIVKPDAGPEPVHPTLARLDDQLGWYEASAKRSQRSYRALKLVALVIGAAIPVGAALGASAAVAGVLGGIVVVLEGVQQLFHYQENWLRYRGVAEALRTEKHLFEARAGSYATASDRLPLLAERIEALFAQERSAWTADQSRSLRHHDDAS
jgi:hypothetical protein